MSNSNFNTPPELLDKVRMLDDRGIGLDPCGNEMSMVCAKTEWRGLEASDVDGLEQNWRGHGLVFMNPPHSMSPNNIEPWIYQAWKEFIVLGGPPDDQFVGLIPAKTDSVWFHEHVIPFPVKIFLRPKFWMSGEPMKGPGKFSSMLIYAGHQPEKFKSIFGSMGWVV